MHGAFIVEFGQVVIQAAVTIAICLIIFVFINILSIKQIDFTIITFNINLFATMNATIIYLEHSQ